MSEKELELDGYQKKVARAATPHQVFAPTLRRAEAQAAKGVSLLIRKQDQLKEYVDELRELGCGIGHVRDAWVKDLDGDMAQIHLANPVYMDSPPVAGSKIAIFELNDLVKIYKVVDFRGVSIQFCICELVDEIYLGEDVIEEEDVEPEEFVELDEDNLAEMTAIVEEDVEKDGLADLVSLVSLVAMKPEDACEEMSANPPTAAEMRATIAEFKEQREATAAEKAIEEEYGSEDVESHG